MKIWLSHPNFGRFSPILTDFKFLKKGKISCKKIFCYKIIIINSDLGLQLMLLNGQLEFSSISFLNHLFGQITYIILLFTENVYIYILFFYVYILYFYTFLFAKLFLIAFSFLWATRRFFNKMKNREFTLTMLRLK